MNAASPRIERARAQLDRLHREAAAADKRVAQFGPHCRACRYSSYSGKRCLHPVNQAVSVDAYGKASVEGDKRTRDMRHDSGLCGPEAALFEPRPFLLRVPLFIVGGLILAAIPLYFAFTVEYLGPIGMFAIFGLGLTSGEWVEGRYS